MYSIILYSETKVYTHSYLWGGSPSGIRLRHSYTFIGIHHHCHNESVYVHYLATYCCNYVIDWVSLLLHLGVQKHQTNYQEIAKLVDDCTQLVYTDHTWYRIVMHSPWYRWDLVIAPICSMAARLKSLSLAGTGEASHVICIPDASSSQNHDMSPQSVEWIAEYGTPMCHKVIIAWSNSVNF